MESPRLSFTLRHSSAPSVISGISITWANQRGHYFARQVAQRSAMKDWHEESLKSRDAAVLLEKLSCSVAYAPNIFVGEYRISTFH